jgi:putative flippase GtrA
MITFSHESFPSGNSQQAQRLWDLDSQVLHRRVKRVTRHGYGFRFSLFALVGGLVFLAGLALQVALVRYAGIGADWSYAAQAIFSIELSYLLNRYLTWRDRSAGFWAAAWKFNVQKLLMTVVNLAAYALLVRAGMEYIVANIVLTAIFTPVNYFAADLLVFVRGRHRGGLGEPVEPRLPSVLPAVSVVIPCKSSERTIRTTVDSFLGQDYPALSEVILVGDVNDATWAPLADITDPRLVLIEQEQTPGRRDPNVKRDKGIKKSVGDVIALADSDIVVDPGWLGRAVALLNGQGGGLVAGGMRSINDTFWGRFVDNNVMAAKTPRVPRPYQVTAKNFGARGCKPPVTANAVFTRELYDSVQLDTTWAYGYEDYEWFWRLALEGHAILFASELTAAHHHRRSFSQLVREYRQSAHGCAQFIRAHPESPLARKRAAQAFGLPTAALGALSLAALATVTGYGTLVAGLLLVAGILVSGREVARARSLEGLTYAPAALALGGVYAATIAGNLMRPAARRAAAPTWGESTAVSDSTAVTGVGTLERSAGATEPAPGRRRAPQAPSGHRPPRRSWRPRVCWPLAAILAVQSALSLMLIRSNTASSDEALYLWAGHVEIAHWLHSSLTMPALGSYLFADYFSGAPQLYPVVGATMDSVGGLMAARLLCLAFMLAATLLLYSTANRVFGRNAAIIAAFAWATTESALRMGAYATYDPMAIFFICLGAWFAIQSAYRRMHGELVALSVISLVLGSMTAYSYAIYILPIVGVATLVWARERGWQRALVSGASLLALTCLVLAAVPTFLNLWHGIFFTTLARTSLADYGSTSSILNAVWSYGGLLIIASLAGGVLLFASATALSERLLGVALAGSALLVPVYQTFDAHTGWALDKHMSCGVWLGSMAVGAGLARISWPQIAPRWGAAVIAIAAVFPFYLGWTSAFGVQVGWPNEGRLITALRSIPPVGDQRDYVDSNPPLMSYYTMPESVNGVVWVNSLSLHPPGPSDRWTDFYRSALKLGNYGIVVLTFSGTLKSADLPREVFHALLSPSQQQLVQIASSDTNTPGLYDFVVALDQDPHYRLVSTGPYSGGFGYGTDPGAFAIWRRVPGPVTLPGRTAGI